MELDARDRLVALVPRLRAFAFSLARNHHEADDLVQAACERALRSLASYREGTNFDAWVMRILRNLWIDGFRRSRNETVVDTSAPEYDVVGEDGRRVAEDRLVYGDVRAAIDALPEEQRSVLVLVCIDDLTYRDAADVLDIPIGTVMSRLARARRAVASSSGYREDAVAAPRRSQIGGGSS